MRDSNDLSLKTLENTRRDAKEVKDEEEDEDEDQEGNDLVCLLVEVQQRSVRLHPKLSSIRE